LTESKKTLHLTKLLCAGSNQRKMISKFPNPMEPDKSNYTKKKFEKLNTTKYASSMFFRATNSR